MNPIRIAIIGYGKIAEDQHAPAIRGNNRLQLVATSSRSGQGVEKTYTDWRELIRSEAIDAVAITTPPGPRFEIARECISQGLHCLLEKPPTAGLSQIADLQTLAKAKPVCLYTTWHAQHHATVEAAAKALVGKRIKSMEIRWHEDVHKWHPGQQWIWEPGGFGVFDPGINAFSIATRIFPGGLCVASAELCVPANAHTPIAADIIFSSPQAEGPLHASLDWRRAEGEEWTIAVETSDGDTVRLEDGGATLVLNGAGPQRDNGVGEYPDIYRTFVDLIDQRQSLVDVQPFRLVADSLLSGLIKTVDPVQG
ncbi:MAG TPA: Gfo/Idh/MocA family oxidoreductase [Sphingomicrobium sp.]|nr:Gfo/Idh/MocA family oxidoreductase [Sphingomicrobium sp.]